MRFPFLPFVAVVCFANACSSSSSPAGAAGSPDASADPSADAAPMPVLGGYDPMTFGGARPVQLYVPSGYVASTPAPLVILLHGYAASGGLEELYLGLRAVAETSTVLYAHPDGTTDTMGKQFWNATDACCNLYGSTVDDDAYLTALITEIGTRYTVDPKRVYFIGHSNGAFMSYRMACNHADVVAGMVSIAGAMWIDTSKCKPSAAVSVLQVHGTADQTILYGGSTTGAGGGSYPGATTSVGDWVTFNGCTTPGDTSLPNLDIESSLAGAETSVTQYKAGCRTGSEVDLWSMQGGPHIPGFTPTFAPMIFQFLLSHPKP